MGTHTSSSPRLANSQQVCSTQGNGIRYIHSSYANAVEYVGVRISITVNGDHCPQYTYTKLSTQNIAATDILIPLNRVVHHINNKEIYTVVLYQSQPTCETRTHASHHSRIQLNPPFLSEPPTSKITFHKQRYNPAPGGVLIEIHICPPSYSGLRCRDRCPTLHYLLATRCFSTK